MLRRLATLNPSTSAPEPVPERPAVEEILRTDAAKLALLLEAAWHLRQQASSLKLDQDPLNLALALAGRGDLLQRFGSGERRFLHDHLIYAYLVENTRCYEIFSRVVREFLHGERLGIPQQEASYRWLRTTEELFLKDASPFQLQALVSRVRPDIRASRRNAYYRMFGMDLNHGADGGGPYPYDKAEAANRGFVATFEEFLREVWRGIENASNTAGPNVTDDATIANLALRLQNMLNTRRGTAPVALNLAREEFEFVNTMAWFHLTLLFDTPIVVDLRATAASPEERLRLIGERVGIPAAAHSHSYFILASAVSTLLRQIEVGHYSDGGSASDLYLEGPIRNMMASIITHWSMATGRDLKSPRVSVGGPLPTVPLRAPLRSVPTTTPSLAGDGSLPVAGST